MISSTSAFLGLILLNPLSLLVGANENIAPVVDPSFIDPSWSARNDDRRDTINEAVEYLKSLGIHGVNDLCHPDSNDFSPLIPLCSESASDYNIGGKPVDVQNHQQSKRTLIRKRNEVSSRNISTVYESPKSQRQWQHSFRRNLNEKPADEDRDLWFYIINIGGAMFSIFVVALIAGMFLGFLTLDPLDLRIKMRAAIDPTEREAAAAIFPLVTQNHRLLVTLLVMNAIAYECLPLFLDNLLPTYLTIVFSVSLLLLFGEIVPSAIFTGPDQLILASKLAPMVKWSMKALHPVTYPLVKLLDRLVPDDESEEEYNRAELSALVRIQYEERMKAQKQRDLANSIFFDKSNAGNGTVSGKNMALRKNQHVHHLANHVKAEKQRKTNNAQNANDLDFKTQRSWRRLKEEIMYAVAEKKQNESSSVIDGVFEGIGTNTGETHNADSGGFGSFLTADKGVFGSFHKRTSSSNSISAAEPAPLEQIAPPLERTEVRVVEGALNLKTMCALDVYTPLRMIFALPETMHLTKENMAEIYGEGWSRIPVYEPQPPPNEHRINAVKGILMTRQLIMVDWDHERTVSSLPLYIPPCVSPRMNLVKLLHLLRGGGSLIAFVCAGKILENQFILFLLFFAWILIEISFFSLFVLTEKGPHLAERALKAGKAVPIEAGFMGLVTLQDVLESVLQERIYDEEDVAQRNLASAVLTQWAAEKVQKFMKRRKLRKSGSIITLQNKGSEDVSPEKAGMRGSEQVANDRTPLLAK